jgi:hypothetical protein
MLYFVGFIIVLAPIAKLFGSVSARRAGAASEST